MFLTKRVVDRLAAGFGRMVGYPAFVMKNDVGDDDDDEPLNEDDDDDDDELDDLDQGEELNTQHLVLAQFDKVTCTKSRWKCALKDGIMHINNDDILFNKKSCESQLVAIAVRELTWRCHIVYYCETWLVRRRRDSQQIPSQICYLQTYRAINNFPQEARCPDALRYELPDSHPLLKGLDKREPDDPRPYLLAI